MSGVELNDDESDAEGEEEEHEWSSFGDDVMFPALDDL